MGVLADDKRLRWVDRLLVFVAVLMAYSCGPTLLDRFVEARRVAVAMHPTRRRPGRSHRGFSKALSSRGVALLAKVADHLRRLLERDAGAAGQWLTHGFAVFGVDSSKLDCPMTRGNEQAIGVAGRSKSWPQLLLTCLFHVGTNVPWAFKRGDAKAGERAHLLELLATLPAGALIVADAGFVGYEFFARVLASGRHVLVRVGSNVRLLRGLGGVHAEQRGDVVWLWPGKARREGRPPLTLRLLTVVDPRRNRRMHLLTSVSDATRLSDRQLIELYAMRWSVELKFRALKQTMCRRKLLSDSPASARAECDWSALGHWMLEMMSWRASRSRRRSVALALRAVRRTMTGARGAMLAASLAQSLGDSYKRKSTKAARHWPHKKCDKPPGEPVARIATEDEVAHAAQLIHNKAAA